MMDGIGPVLAVYWVIFECFLVEGFFYGAFSEINRLSAF